jgi:hypothetical protein
MNRVRAKSGNGGGKNMDTDRMEEENKDKRDLENLEANGALRDLD